MGVAAAMYLCESRRISRGLSFALTLLLAKGLVISESRSGLLGLFVLTLWWGMGRRRQIVSVHPIYILVVWAYIAILLLTWPAFITDFHAAGNLQSSGAATLNLAPGTRLQIWPQLLHAVSFRPWFGWGLREVSTAHNAILDQYQTSEPVSYTHLTLPTIYSV